MASELVRNVWCDVHSQDTDERVAVAEVGEGVVIRVGELSGVVDLCADCITNHVVPLAEFVETYCRSEDDAPSPKDAARKKLTCPDCGKVYHYTNSLRTHVATVHHKTMPYIRKPHGKKTCPFCNFETSTGPGLASHVRNVHPNHWAGPGRPYRP